MTTSRTVTPTYRATKRSPNCAAAIAAAAVLFAAHPTAQAANLAGGIYVSRLGGTASFGAGATAADLETLLPVFVDNFAINASTPQLTLSLPTALDAGTGNQAVTIPAIGQGGTNVAEGIMQASPSGKYLAFSGYFGAAGTTRTSSAASKTVAMVDVTTGSINSKLGFASSIGPRSALTVDGTNAYFAGSGNGIRYVKLNDPPTAAPNTGTTVSLASATNVNQRAASVFGGQLFLSGASSVGRTGDSLPNPGISALGTGIPTTDGTGTRLQKYIMTTNANPAQFVMLDQNPTVGFVNTIDPANPVDTKLDVTYVATDAGIEKWTYDGSNWSRPYILSSGLGTSTKVTINTVGVTFAGTDSSGNNILFATTGGSVSGSGQGNALMKLVDTGAGATWQLVVASPDNTWFRGLSVVKAPGDANGDWKITPDDYALLDRGFAKSLTGFSNGDFDYSGTIDAADYLVIDQAFAAAGGTFSPDFLAARDAQFGDAYVASLVAAIPEPASLSLLATGALALASRRRRRH